MANLDHLYPVDERYRAFEDHAEGTLVSLSGPGTGKTYSILRRIASLLVDRHIEVSSICYVTFNKEISRAFRSDYSEEFASDNEIAGVPRISTLHSLACRLIRNRGFSFGYDGELYFTSVAPKKDTFSSKVFLSDLIHVVNNANLNTVARIRNALIQVKDAWRDIIDPEELVGLTAIAYSGYVELARAYRLFDWDHTIPKSHQLYQYHENRPGWLTRIEHLLIDEYQDFNRAEQLLIASIMSNVSSTVIVGDDNQSLYSGRGGSPDGLRELFVSQDANQVSLIRCQRCSSVIVKHANTFLRTMTPNPRVMHPLNIGGSVQSLRFKSSKSECAYLAQFLNNCLDEMPENPLSSDGIVCLFPARKSLQYYFEKLNSVVPCHTIKLNDDDSRSQLSLALELCVRTGQRFVQRLLINYYPDIKPKHQRAMVNLIIQRDIAPIEALVIMIENGDLRGVALEFAENFISTCKILSSRNPQLIAENISEWTEIDTDDLIIHLTSFFESLDDSDQETAIANFCDLALPSTAQPSSNLRSISFLTMHSSKGLTKRTVVMPGLEDAWLPGTARGLTLEERQRLFYVALTRATHNVLITHPTHRARGDPMNYDTPGRSKVSRFVNESEIPTIYHS